jgi:hypothetical protein
VLEAWLWLCLCGGGGPLRGGAQREVIRSLEMAPMEEINIVLQIRSHERHPPTMTSLGDTARGQTDVATQFWTFSLLNCKLNKSLFFSLGHFVMITKTD